MDEQNVVVVINNDGMGQTDEVLRQKLVTIFLETILTDELIPTAVCMYADGVKLAVEGSPIIEQLKRLESQGTRIVLCGTCLTHFGLRDRVQVGIIGGMHDIVEYQWKADKVLVL